MKNQSNVTTIIKNGVYVVYQDGSYEVFNGKNSKENISMIGIAQDGHTFGVPLDHDYGRHPLLKNEFNEYNEHCKEEVDAMLNWDFVGETEHLKKLGLAFDLKDGHYLPTMPVFLAQYAERMQLNKALSYADAEEIDFSVSRWFSQRYNVNNAWIFFGYSRGLGNYYVNTTVQVGAVALWEPKI